MPPFTLVWLVNQETVPIEQKVKFLSFVALSLIFVSCGYFVPNGTKPEYYALRFQIAISSVQRPKCMLLSAQGNSTSMDGSKEYFFSKFVIILHLTGM